MDVHQPKPVFRSAVEPVDVLIITAAAGEDDAVRAVDEGGLGAWEERRGRRDSASRFGDAGIRPRTAGD
jgi:hypothetical protein